MSAKSTNAWAETRRSDPHSRPDALGSAHADAPRWSRRAFLAAGVAGAAAFFPGRLRAAVEHATPPMPDLANWAAVRGQFSLDRSLRHFSSFYLASHPRPVPQAIDAFRKAIDANDPAEVDEALRGVREIAGA